MLKRAVILLPILFSAPAANAASFGADCMMEASARKDIEGFRECVTDFMNKTLITGVPNNGITLMHIGHKRGIIRIDSKFANISHAEFAKLPLKDRHDFLDNMRVDEINSYCVAIGDVRKVFKDGATFHYYDRDGKFIYISAVYPEECNAQTKK
ncbi:hypothetical protein [Klebsiella pneumoniae]|uniref:hypothetical protein n=1 Tax=Klebsiella pneumoniae TaxID=573 RepID=UPI000E3DA63A|nr:hypothetical protein [Klebsiella pneumoniae]HBX6199704.1 hypothetical protein [Klebsiella pneumoniae]